MRLKKLYLSLLILPAVTSVSSFAVENSLNDVIIGVLTPREIVSKNLGVAEYLNNLEIKPAKVPLSSNQRYLLARHLLDCHHLSQALHHQGYSIRADSPISSSNLRWI